MNRARSTHLLLLAILLAASQVVLVGHLAAHAQPMVEHCALCASHAELQAAIPVADWPAQGAVVATPRAEAPSTSLPTAPQVNFRQRAPPATSS